MDATQNLFYELNQNNQKTKRLYYNKKVAEQCGVTAAIILHLICFYIKKDEEKQIFYSKTGIAENAAFRTISQIAKDIDRSISTVKRSIQILKDNDLIFIKKVKGFKANFYQYGKKLLSFLGVQKEKTQPENKPTPKTAAAVEPTQKEEQRPHQAYTQPTKNTTFVQPFRQPEPPKQQAKFKPKPLFKIPFTDTADDETVFQYMKNEVIDYDYYSQQDNYSKEIVIRAGREYLKGRQINAAIILEECKIKRQNK